MISRDHKQKRFRGDYLAAKSRLHRSPVVEVEATPLLRFHAAALGVVMVRAAVEVGHVGTQLHDRRLGVAAPVRAQMGPRSLRHATIARALGAVLGRARPVEHRHVLTQSRGSLLEVGLLVRARMERRDPRVVLRLSAAQALGEVTRCALAVLRHVLTRSQDRPVGVVVLVRAPTGRRNLRVGVARSLRWRQLSIVKVPGAATGRAPARVGVARSLGLTQSQRSPVGLVLHVRVQMGKHSRKVAHRQWIA